MSASCFLLAVSDIHVAAVLKCHFPQDTEEEEDDEDDDDDDEQEKASSEADSSSEEDEDDDDDVSCSSLLAGFRVNGEKWKLTVLNIILCCCVFEEGG